MYFRKAVVWPACLVALVLLSSCNSRSKSNETMAAHAPHLRPLNVVVVTVDTLRPDHLHCYGDANIETPSIDGIAQRGVLFENAVTQTPLTPPSHASIFTGQNPNVHKVRSTGGFVLQSSAHPLARILQEQGWDTAAFIGSAVLKRIFGFNNGFAVYDDEMPKPRNAGRDVLEDPERPAGVVVDHAIHWLEGQSGKPFFMWVHVYDPHLPHTPPAEFRQKYKGRLYDGEIAYADRELGRLFDAVAKKSPPEKTIIAVLSDHGESLGEHGEESHGIFLYDSTLRIAFMISGAGVPAGVRVKQQARTVDFLPTILDLMGGKPPRDIQGLSLVPTFSARSVPTDISYAETLYPKINMNWAELRGIRTNRWKYIRAPKRELYDLTADPGERANIIAQHPDQVDKFEAQLKNVLGVTENEKVDSAMVDERLMAQLKSLGYLAGAGGRSWELNGSGPDPKDEVGVLKLLDTAESTEINLPEAHRVALLQQALAEDPKNPSIYYELGGHYEKDGRRDEAIKLYQTALERGVESGRLHARLADLALQRGDKDLAIAEYEKAARFNPADLKSQNNLATAYLERGRLDDAERVFKWILSNDSTYAEAQNGMGLVCIQRQNPNGARAYFERAVQLDPDLVEAHMNLGLLYEMAGDRSRARASFEMFLAKASPAQYGNVIPKVRQEVETLR